jgi:uncharacterized protein YbjT (DUF2867 family)
VVALSALGAELAGGTGFIASLHRQEQRLRSLEGVNVPFLRAGAFFEDFRSAPETIRDQGVVADSDELAAIMTTGAGVSPDFAAQFVAFNHALSEGRLRPLEGRTAENTMPHLGGAHAHEQ